MNIRALAKLKKVNYKFDNKSVWIGFFIILILFFCFWLAGVLNKAATFKIREVKCNISLGADLKEWVTKYALGRQLSGINIKYIYAQIFKIHPEYKEIYILREFPSTLNIEIKLRKPFAQLKIKGFYLIDRQGMVISDMSDEPFRGFVPIDITQRGTSLSRGNLIKDRRLDFAFELIEKVKRHPFFNKLPIALVNTVSLQSAYFVIGNTQVLMGAGDIERKLAVLERVIKEQLKNNISSVEYIDLRYPKVYLGIKR